MDTTYKHFFLTPANKLIWPNTQESGANTEPADYTTVQLNTNANIMAIYLFWQWPLVWEAMKQTLINVHNSKSKATVLDGSCVTGGGRIFPNQVDYIRSIKDKYDSASAAYQQKNFGLCQFLV